MDAVARVLEEYAESLGIPVQMEIPRQRVAWPRGGRGLWLHPLALPGRSGWLFQGPIVTPTTFAAVCGLPLPPDRRDAWLLSHPGRCGRPLQDGDGQVVGLLRETDVYLLFDLLRQEPPLARLLTRAVLDLGLRVGRPLLPALLGLDGETLDGRIARLRQATEVEALRGAGFWRPAPREASEAVPQESTEALTREVRELEAGLRASARQMNRLEQRLVLADRRLAELERHRASDEALAREFDRIAGLPGVTEVQVGDEVLHLYTGLITVDYGARRFRLGRFRLDLHFDGRVFLRNLTDRYETYDHPHVDNGRPCLGNIQGWIQQLIARREFAAASGVLLQYLATVNPSDWRKPVTYWPEAAA
ncbi:MAG TPA: hypothetical protein VMG58_06180 [Candidatus Sulfotelmatobacter sp.]|nr:hypothetical protein [Candidatus Sulfotelmatobacter sp.]